MMTSRFLQLFTRGRYVSVHPVTAAGDDESTTKRKHAGRERFSVAAVAFCLQHDDVFKRHFLKTIEAPKDAYEIALEPEDWGDLILTGKEHALVLEFKLGAPLEDHQSPHKRSFWQKGYGAKIQRHFADEIARDPHYALHYIVVGKKFQPCNRSVLHCRSVPWRDLLVRGGREESAIETDLYDCLGSLGAPDFLNRNMKKTRLDRDARQAMNVCSALQGILRDLDLSKGRSLISPDFFGVEIRNTPKRTNEGLQARLKKLVAPTGRALGWIGYELIGGQFFRSVWFYSKPKAASQLLSQLNGKTQNWKSDGNNVGLLLPSEESSNDTEWFKESLQNVLQVASASPKP